MIKYTPVAIHAHRAVWLIDNGAYRGKLTQTRLHVRDRSEHFY